MRAAEHEQQTTQPEAAAVGGTAITLLTLAHYLSTECRSVVLLWWSALSVIVSEASHTFSHDFAHMNEPMKDCIAKWARSIIWGPGAVDCNANAQVFEFHVQSLNRYDPCMNSSRVWMGGVNGGDYLPRMAGGYQVEGEDPIIELLAGGICQSNQPAQQTIYSSGQDTGCTVVGGCGWREQWVQTYPRFQNVQVDEHGNGSVDTQLWTFAICIHLWLFLVLGSRVVLWLRCHEARDFRCGGYVRFCVQLEKSAANIWTVRFSIALYLGLIVTGLVLSLKGNGRLTGQVSNFLVILFALWKMYSTPYVISRYDAYGTHHHCHKVSTASGLQSFVLTNLCGWIAELPCSETS
jgi:hypothetical protein